MAEIVYNTHNYVFTIVYCILYIEYIESLFFCQLRMSLSYLQRKHISISSSMQSHHSPEWNKTKHWPQRGSFAFFNFSYSLLIVIHFKKINKNWGAIPVLVWVFFSYSIEFILMCHISLSTSSLCLFSHHFYCSPVLNILVY